MSEDKDFEEEIDEMKKMTMFTLVLFALFAGLAIGLESPVIGAGSAGMAVLSISYVFFCDFYKLREEQENIKELIRDAES